MKRMPMRKLRDVLRLSAEGLSTRQIAASLAIGRTTLRGYLDRAAELGLSWQLPPEMSDTDLERRLFDRALRGIKLVEKPRPPLYSIFCLPCSQLCCDPIVSSTKVQGQPNYACSPPSLTVKAVVVRNL